MAGQYTPFTIGISQTLDLSIPGFTIRSVAVDNPGNFWIHFPSLSVISGWIPPRTFGAIVRTGLSSPAPVRVNTIDTPIGFVNPSTDSALASLVALEEAVPPSAGAPVAATSAAQILLATTTTATGGFSIPPGTHAIAVAAIAGGGLHATPLVFGNKSINNYAPAKPWGGASSRLLYGPWLSAVDTSLTFSGASPLDTLAWTAILDPTLINSFSVLQDLGGNNLLFGQQLMASSLPVVIASDQTALSGLPYNTSAAHDTVDAYISSATPGATTNIISFGAGTLAAGGFYDISVLFAYGATAGPADDVRVFVNGAFLAAMLVDPIANRAGPEQVWRRMYVGNPSTAVTLQTIAGSGTATYRALMRLTRVG